MEVCRSVLGRRDVLPHAMAGIQKFGELVHFHLQHHVVATYGTYALEGPFVCLPLMDTNRLSNVCQRKVLELLLEERKINQPLIDQMRDWQHLGFSVDNSVCFPAGDTSGLQ